MSRAPLPAPPGNTGQPPAAAWNAPPPAPVPQPPPRKSSSSCITIVIVVALLAVPMLGVLSALAIYGVRRYLASAKTAEAKNVVSAISRGAAAAYERGADPTGGGDPNAAGGAGKALCGTAVPVPTSIPSGRRYQPETSPGQDYQSGDEYNGWRCLKFGLTQPQYYQYHYSAGSSVVAPASPMACRNLCFEAGAMGDLDADGIPSRFARTGQIDAHDELKLLSQIYIENEFE